MVKQIFLVLRLWSRGETYRFDSFGPSIRRHTDTDRTHLYSHKIRHFDKDWICIRLHLENKKKSIYRFEFLWFINFLYAIIHVKFSSFCNVKITCGDFFWYERALTKFTVLALPAIGTFTRVGPVGVVANTASLTRKIDTFVDICEKPVYFDKWIFFTFKKIQEYGYMYIL